METPIHTAETTTASSPRVEHEKTGDIVQDGKGDDGTGTGLFDASEGAAKTTLSFGNRPEDVILDLRGRNYQLREDKDILSLENHKLKEQKRTLISKYEDVETRLNQTFLENRRLKSLLAAASPHTDDSLAQKFKSLFVKIESWCNEQTFNSGTCSLSEQQLAGLKRSLEWVYVPDNTILEARSSEIGRAYISQVLLDRVFLTSAEDVVNIKDMWTGEREAAHLAHIELRLMKESMFSAALIIRTMR